MELLIMQLSLVSYYFIPLESKYFPWYPVLKYFPALLNKLNRVLRFFTIRVFGTLSVYPSVPQKPSFPLSYSTLL
jgi:hypothetical protein